MEFPHTIKRPLSWSAISSFQYDPESWYKKYCLGEKDIETKEMKLGKFVGDKLASDLNYLPQVPRLDTYEHKLMVFFNKMYLVGYMDAFCNKTKKIMYEYKTGKKAWDQKRADTHGQIDMYLLMHYITTKIPPEEMEVKLVWLPTREDGDFTIQLVEPCIPQIFTTKRTMTDILNFGAYINKTVKEMEDYISTRK